MTITGGATNSSLLQKLGPKVVLVEEAAEILEPCLISAISQNRYSFGEPRYFADNTWREKLQLLEWGVLTVIN